MSKFQLKAVIIASILCLTFQIRLAPVLADVNGPIPTVNLKRLIVKHKAGVRQSTLDRFYAKHGIARRREIHSLAAQTIDVPAGKDVASLKRALLNNRNFEFVEEDQMAIGQATSPNDPEYPNQYHLPIISAPSGWDISTGDANVTIAVLDSGADFTHPDLASKLIAGYDYVNDDSDPTDDYGHGTAVAGIAGAISNNSQDVAGLAWQNNMLVIKVLSSSNWAWYSDIANGITEAADYGARVINISIGGTSYSSTMQTAVNYAWGKGVVVVAAAGNNGNSTPMYPAALTNVIAVSATDSNDQIASWSSYGSWVDVSAPGVSILTTKMGGGYSYRSGTSFASPIITATVALIFSVDGTLTNTEAVNILLQNSDDLGAAGRDDYYGDGRVNVYSSLNDAGGGGMYVELDSFTAVGGSGKVTLEWSTATELDSAGFNILRQDSSDGEFVKVNYALIPAEGNSFTGAHYSFVDYNVVNGRIYSYKLEEIELDGDTNLYETVEAAPGIVSLVSPANGSGLSGDNVTFEVLVDPSVKRLALCISTSETFQGKTAMRMKVKGKADRLTIKLSKRKIKRLKKLAAANHGTFYCAVYGKTGGEKGMQLLSNVSQFTIF